MTKQEEQAEREQQDAYLKALEKTLGARQAAIKLMVPGSDGEKADAFETKSQNWYSNDSHGFRSRLEIAYGDIINHVCAELNAGKPLRVILKEAGGIDFGDFSRSMKPRCRDNPIWNALRDYTKERNKTASQEKWRQNHSPAASTEPQASAPFMKAEPGQMLWHLENHMKRGVPLKRALQITGLTDELLRQWSEDPTPVAGDKDFRYVFNVFVSTARGYTERQDVLGDYLARAGKVQADAPDGKWASQAVMPISSSKAAGK